MKKINFDNYEFRCSSLGTLMTGSWGLTDNQKVELSKLEDKLARGKDLTPLQEDKKKEHEDKRDNPELSVTTKTQLDNIYIKEVYGRRKELSNKYLLKGLGVEDAAIRVLSQVDGELYVKNEERMHNGMLQGECDIKYHWGDSECGLVVDTKSSWDF